MDYKLIAERIKSLTKELEALKKKGVDEIEIKRLADDLQLLKDTVDFLLNESKTAKDKFRR